MKLLVLFVTLAAVADARRAPSDRRTVGSTAKVSLRPKLVHTVHREFLSFGIDDVLAKRNWSRLDLG